MFFRTPFSRPSLGTIALALIVTAVAFLAKDASAGGAWCTSPYVAVQGGATPLVPDQTGQFTIQSVSIGEPFTGCSNKNLKVVMKVASMDPGNTGTAHPPPNAVWTVAFDIPGSANSLGTQQKIFFQFDTTFVPTGGFNYGWVDAPGGTAMYPGGFNCSQCIPGVGACAATGTVAPDGTITMNVNLSSTLSFGTCDTSGTAPSMSISSSQWTPGTLLSSIQGNVQILVGAVGTGEAVNDTSTLGDGEYTVHGNLSCSNPPVAALGASTNAGNAPLTVNFDASTSNIPAGGCGTINSYIFDFGDGSPQVTQATPTISHIYSGCGVTYPARVRVTSTVGLTSSNVAGQDIAMGSCGPPPLVSVVSRKVHGAAGQKDVFLPLPPYTATNHRGVECRTTGNTGTPGVDYMVVFTFLNTITNCGTAGTVGGVVLPGPAQNQCTENLTGLSDQQYTTISLNGVSDGTSTGNVVGPEMGLLVGDVNANGLVNSTDTSQVQAQSGQPVTGDLGSGNYRKDVNANGLINSTDTSAVQSRSGHGLPTAP